MTKEISKGTQKFIWHLVAFVAVFILAMTILNRILPETTHTTTYDQPSQTTVSTQSTDNYSTDFDAVKERVDAANNTTGKEVKSLYSGEGKSTMQKQLETRLFFNTLKSILIGVLLVVVIVVLLKKGFNIKKIKKILNGDEPEDEKPEDKPTSDDEETTVEDTPKEVPDNTDDQDEEPAPVDVEEPPVEEAKDPDEAEVAENCKL